MSLNKILVAVIVFLFSHTVFSANNFKLGVAYDLDGGITAQYNGYSFFLNGDAAAIDFRFQNFTTEKRKLHFYVDLGGFVESYEGNDNTKDDRVGVRAPVGMTFGIAKELQAYVQAVPNYDFNNDDSFNIDGAIGIRFQF